MRRSVLPETSSATGSNTLEVVNVAFGYDAVTPRPAPVPTDGLFAVRVLNAFEIALVPLTDLARHIASQWLHSRAPKVSSEYQSAGPGQTFIHGKGLQHVQIAFSPPPLLASGDDPFWHGVDLKPDEYVALRAKLDELRSAQTEPPAPQRRPVRRRREKK